MVRKCVLGEVSLEGGFEWKMRRDKQKEGGQGGKEHAHTLFWGCGRTTWPGFASSRESVDERVGKVCWVLCTRLGAERNPDFSEEFSEVYTLEKGAVLVLLQEYELLHACRGNTVAGGQNAGGAGGETLKFANYNFPLAVRKKGDCNRHSPTGFKL